MKSKKENKKLRILVLNYEFPPLGGGASPVSFEIAKGYTRLGHKVDVVTMGYRDLPRYEWKDGINIYRVPCWRSKKEMCHPWEQATYIWSAKRFLRKQLKTHIYDINHTHFIIPTGIVSLWLKKRYGLPYIVTSHGSDVPGHNTDRFVFLHKFTKPLMRKICKHSLCVTTPSHYLSNLIRENIGEFEVKVVPNGAQDFLDKSIQKESIILSSGRFFPLKGFHLLIEAFCAINVKAWKLYLVGDGPFRSNLVALSKGDPNIVFTGWLDNSGKEYRDIMNKAKIFALLSRRETQGIVLIEAMSTGCAILSSDLTACKETISEDVGYLVNLEDKEGIIERLEKMIKDEELLGQFMSHARKRYEENYTYNKVIREYEKIL